jgi:hypothetical protein
MLNVRIDARINLLGLVVLHFWHMMPFTANAVVDDTNRFPPGGVGALPAGDLSAGGGGDGAFAAVACGVESVKGV